MSLWVKAFTLLDGARGAVARSSLLTLRILARTAFETELHALVITESGLPDVPERLAAYLAWSTWNDYRHWKNLAYPGNLIATYSPKPEREFIQELGEGREAWEKLFGPLEVVSDQEAERDWRQGMAAASRHVAELEALLAHPTIARWVQRLKTVAPNGEQVFFGALFSDAATSLSSKMRELGIKYAYAALYGEGSMAVHSASYEQTVLLTRSETDAVPRFTATEDEVARYCANILTWTKRILVRLQIMLAKLTPLSGTGGLASTQGGAE